MISPGWKVRSVMMTKNLNTLKTRKTHMKHRITYKYYDVKGKLVTELIAGEKGITEVDIKALHALDDNEVNNNLKNLKPERSDEEKEKIKIWKKNFIEDFKRDYGYEPLKSDIEYFEKERFPKDYNLSLDAELVNQDKSHIENKIIRKEEFEWSDRMVKALEILTEKEKEVIICYFENGLQKQEIADKLGVSNAAISKHFKKALKKIKENY